MHMSVYIVHIRSKSHVLAQAVSHIDAVHGDRERHVHRPPGNGTDAPDSCDRGRRRGTIRAWTANEVIMRALALPSSVVWVAPHAPSKAFSPYVCPRYPNFRLVNNTAHFKQVFTAARRNATTDMTEYGPLAPRVASCLSLIVQHSVKEEVLKSRLTFFILPGNELFHRHAETLTTKPQHTRVARYQRKLLPQRYGEASDRPPGTTSAGGQS